MGNKSSELVIESSEMGNESSEMSNESSIYIKIRGISIKFDISPKNTLLHLKEKFMKHYSWMMNLIFFFLKVMDYIQITIL